MTNKSDLLALVERCEVAAWHDWNCDHAIACALGWEQLPMDWRMQRDWRGPDGGIQREFPRFTKSVDAALTLVPTGAIWEVGRKVNYPAAKGEPDRAHYAFVNVGRPGEVNSFGGKSCGTPALALCAAALRSRAASADTLPKGQDAQQGLAGTESGAVPQGQTPSPSPSPAAGR